MEDSLKDVLASTLNGAELLDLLSEEDIKHKFVKDPEYGHIDEEGNIIVPTLLGANFESDKYLHLGLTKGWYDEEADVVLLTNKYNPDLDDIDPEGLMLLLGNHTKSEVIFMYKNNGTFTPKAVIGLTRNYLGPNDDDEGHDFLMLTLKD